MEPTADFITPGDHEAGFKDLEVQLRSGERRKLRVTAVPYRKLRAIHAEWKARHDTTAEDFVGMITATAVDVPLESIAPSSMELVETVAYCLAQGYPEQKKTEAAWHQVMAMIRKMQVTGRN